MFSVDKQKFLYNIYVKVSEIKFCGLGKFSRIYVLIECRKYLVILMKKMNYTYMAVCIYLA